MIMGCQIISLLTGVCYILDHSGYSFSSLINYIRTARPQQQHTQCRIMLLSQHRSMKLPFRPCGKDGNTCTLMLKLHQVLRYENSMTQVFFKMLRVLVKYVSSNSVNWQSLQLLFIFLSSFISVFCYW